MLLVPAVTPCFSEHSCSVNSRLVSLPPIRPPLLVLFYRGESSPEYRALAAQSKAVCPDSSLDS